MQCRECGTYVAGMVEFSCPKCGADLTPLHTKCAECDFSAVTPQEMGINYCPMCAAPWPLSAVLFRADLQKSDRSTMRKEDSRERPGALLEIPAGYRVVTLVVIEPPQEQSATDTQDGVAAYMRDGRTLDIMALCAPIQEKRHSQDDRERLAAHLLEEVSWETFEDLSRHLEQSFPTWKLFRLDIAM